jgi:hypothetical protein
LVVKGTQENETSLKKEFYTIKILLTDALGNHYGCKIVGDYYNMSVYSGEENTVP